MPNVRGNSRKTKTSIDQSNFSCEGVMKIKKVMIIGPGGSGKSTLARELGKVLKLPVYHLDALNWKPGWIPTPELEWDNLLKELVKREKWIIDGNYGRTLDIRISEADTIILFDLPRWQSIYRVIKRRFMYYGKTRPDLNEGCPERISFDFLKWIWNYKRNKKPIILEKLGKVADSKVIIIVKSQAGVNKLVERFMMDESYFKVGENIL